MATLNGGAHPKLNGKLLAYAIIFGVNDPAVYNYYYFGSAQLGDIVGGTAEPSRPTTLVNVNYDFLYNSNTYDYAIAIETNQLFLGTYLTEITPSSPWVNGSRNINGTTFGFLCTKFGGGSTTAPRQDFLQARPAQDTKYIAKVTLTELGTNGTQEAFNAMLAKIYVNFKVITTGWRPVNSANVPTPPINPNYTAAQLLNVAPILPSTPENQGKSYPIETKVLLNDPIFGETDPKYNISTRVERLVSTPTIAAGNTNSTSRVTSSYYTAKTTGTTANGRRTQTFYIKPEVKNIAYRGTTRDTSVVMTMAYDIKVGLQ